jgi:RNA polymerase sigma-70 factor, ECF subfamily
MDVINNGTADDRLIEDIIAGNDAAFVQLVRRYKHKVIALSARFARDTDELDDICQDVFIKVYEHLGKFRHAAPFEHWLARITIRTCYDALRRRQKENRNVPLDELHYQLADDTNGINLAAEQARNILELGLALLRPDERLVITLLELEEKSIREVAGMTGWSEANVKVRGFRARQKLRRILERDHGR